MVWSSARCGARCGAVHGVEQCTVWSTWVTSRSVCYQRADVRVQTQGQVERLSHDALLLLSTRQQEHAHVGCVGDAGGRSRAHT